MFCRKCGMELKEGEPVCPRCGQAAGRNVRKIENQAGGYPGTNREVSGTGITDVNTEAQANFNRQTIGKYQAIGIGGCVLMALSIFFPAISMRTFYEQESATIKQCLEAITRNSIPVFVFMICLCGSAVWFYKSKWKYALIAGVIASLPVFLSLFLLMGEIGDAYRSALHLEFGTLGFFVGFVLILIAGSKGMSSK